MLTKYLIYLGSFLHTKGRLDKFNLGYGMSIIVLILFAALGLLMAKLLSSLDMMPNLQISKTLFYSVVILISLTIWVGSQYYVGKHFPDYKKAIVSVDDNALRKNKNKGILVLIGMVLFFLLSIFILII